MTEHLNLWLIPAYSWRGAAWASLASDGALAIAIWTVILALEAKSRSSHSRLVSERLSVPAVSDCPTSLASLTSKQSLHD